MIHTDMASSYDYRLVVLSIVIAVICVLCRARSRRTCDRVAWPAPACVANRWGRRDGIWHMVHALHRDAGLPLAGRDHLAATAAIRVSEKTSGTHILIIAMAAHALKVDEERCIAAGMDAYLSKPIQLSQLLKSWAVSEKCTFQTLPNRGRSGPGSSLSLIFNRRAGCSGLQYLPWSYLDLNGVEA
jgi:DNA-binding NarL/FixJ family response regulator